MSIKIGIQRKYSGTIIKFSNYLANSHFVFFKEKKRKTSYTITFSVLFMF